MLSQMRLSPLKFQAYGPLPGVVDTPKKVDEKSTTNNSHFQLRITYKKGDADHSVPKSLGPAFEKADESASSNQRTISLIAALALTIFVIANRKKMPNKDSMLNFLNRNPVIKG